MDKVKYSDWFKAVIIENTSALREKIEGSSITKEQKALAAYFSKGDLKRSQIRFDALKEFLADLGMPPVLDGLSITSIDREVEPIRLALLRCTSNPNGHSYGTNYFLIASNSMGFKQDGNTGNSYPRFNDGGWEVPDEAKTKELAEKLLAITLRPNTELRDFVRSMRSFSTAFVDFTEFDAVATS